MEEPRSINQTESGSTNVPTGKGRERDGERGKESKSVRKRERERKRDNLLQVLMFCLFDESLPLRPEQCIVRTLYYSHTMTLEMSLFL